MAISSKDVAAVAFAARTIPPAQGRYVCDDLVTNLLWTVIDFQMHVTAVEKALAHYEAHRRADIRTLDDLRALFDLYPNDQAGNTALALELWGYKMWTRAEMLRRLVTFFDQIGVRTQDSLRRWAERAEFKRDFEGRVPGLGLAVFQWLVMRQGVDTVKPDIHVQRFAEEALARRLSETDVVDVVTAAARVLGIPAKELDWAIWESRRRPTASITVAG